MSQEPVDISVVIGQEEGFIIPCLESIFGKTDIPLNVYVICNWKSQKIVEDIRRQFPEVHIFVNAEPRGFAENHNSIMKRTKGEYILILNDDALILGDSLKKLTDYLDGHPQAAVVSPKLLNPDLSLQHSTYSFPTLFKIGVHFSGVKRFIPFNKYTYTLASVFYKKAGTSYWQHDEIREVDTLAGACVLIRRKAIEEVGLMDEVSLAYGEEAEWHFRMRKKGWKIVYYPPAQVVHYGRQSSKKMGAAAESEQVKAVLNFYRKHRALPKYILLKGIILAIFSLKLLWVVTSGQKERAESCKQVVKAAF